MKKPLSFRTLAALLLATTASACGSVNPAGLVAASRLDPLTTPPAAIAVAVGVPQTLRLADGDAQLRLAFSGGTAASTVMLEETAPLQVSPSDAAGPRPNTADETVYVARIAPDDAPRIAAIQRDISALRAGGTEGTGSLTISVVGGCFVGAVPSAITVSTWIQTDPAADFVQLTRQQDMMRAMNADEAALLRAGLKPCSD